VGKLVKKHQILQIIPIVGLVLLVLAAIYGRHAGIFDSVVSLQAFIHHFGDKAILIYILIQLVQPVVPILPGGIATVVGMLMFGNIEGLIYSYIGLVLGEIVLFLLVRYYGSSFAQFILSEKNFQKFEDLLIKHKKGIRRLLIISFIVPFMPDDIICLVAGMSPMSFREYLGIIAILKPWSLATYGFLIIYIFHQVQHF
jgi:uncharacterized membrane protein YdjX (TVP38/TMEM64 family)